ncbi:MAG: SpoIID/LytB domain-containing protein [Nocardioidaceae bacterium]
MNTKMKRSSLRRMITAALGAAVILPMAGLVALPAEADQTYYVPVTDSWTIVGHGFGHGHGMSQYGAQGAALAGKTYQQILNFYYPGTAWASAKGLIRVLITADTSSSVDVLPESGLSVVDLTDGKKYLLPTNLGATRWRLAASTKGNTTAVQYTAGKGWVRWRVPDHKVTLQNTGQFVASRPLTLLLPDGEQRQYRGALRAARPSPDATVRDTVNVLPLDMYVRGVVADEMPASWDPAALEAQAVAARTYGAWLRAQNPTRYYQICDTTSCQVYGGVGAEQPSSNAAVAATARQILTYANRPAFTQFSSSSGGWTSYGGVSYLPAQPDPYDGWSGNPVHTWTVRVDTAALQRAHPQIGTLTDLRVTGRDGNGQWGGRVTQIVLDGTAGSRSLTGDDLRWMYGLRSDWFTIKPTPIISRWLKLGGPKSSMGMPATGESRVSDGSQQRFHYGRMFWNQQVGARNLGGPILAKFMTYGGPGSSLGWPVSAPAGSALHGHKSFFQAGAIFSRPETGAHVVSGAILAYYRKQGAASSWLGYPTSDVISIRTGTRGGFEHAIVTWKKSTNTLTIKKR